MNNSAELVFLRDTLQKRRISMAVISQSEPILNLIDPLRRELLETLPMSEITVGQFFGRLESVTKYKLEDPFGCRYIYFLLPTGGEEKILFIGPYLTEKMQARAISKLHKNVSLRLSAQNNLEEYYATIPIIPDSDCFFALIDTFCEHIWNSPAFAVVDVNRRPLFPPAFLNVTAKSVDTNDTDARITLMENRYAFENELIRAVSLGQQHKVDTLMSAIYDYPFEMRMQDPLRNAKNYSVIMNTLLRKGAEHGGVHPIYLNDISSRFAERIEASSSYKDTIALMKEMFREYCNLVYTHSTKKYSPLVQKVILIVDSDLTADLTLRTLAAQLEISPGHLATVFKKDTGKTLSQHVWEKRIRHAEYLLKNTALQIQSVAAHCGIMDIQYFSKTFKKLTGQTPKEYREAYRS